MFIWTILLFTMSFAHANVPCSSLWASGFPEIGHTDSAGECFPFTPVATVLGSGQELFLKKSAMDNPVAKEAMEAVAAVLVRASGMYSLFASVPKIRMVYSDIPHGGDGGTESTFAMTFTEFYNLGAEFCPIVVYPASALLSKEYFDQMIAHEIYHCVQKAAFPVTISNVSNGDDEARFWSEGIAQYMSNSIYPTYDFEYASNFGTYDQHLPFFQQSSPYLSEAIFQGLIWHGGSDATIHAMQGGFSGLSGLDDAMAIPNISDVFHKTARDMGMHELLDSSGGTAPWPVEKQYHVVSDAAVSSLDFGFMDFAVEPFEVTFAKKGRYHLNSRRGDGIKLSVRKKGETAWQSDFGSTFDTDCDEDRIYEGIYTRVSPDLALNNVHIDIRREENPTCPCVIEERPSDSCLYGTWQVDLGTVRAYLNSLMRGGLNISSVTGDVKLTFTPEGEHQCDYQNLHVIGSPPGNEVVAHMLWNGVDTLKYSSGQRKVCSQMLAKGVQAQAWGVFRGQTIGMPVPMEPVSGQGTMQYNCNATTFSYDINTGPSRLNWVWHRVTPAP